ncbi:reverse transcriptase domain-containing protein [Tanacetum coccineum]
MTGVSRSVAEHRLNIQEGHSPVRQKKRGQAPERPKAIQAEVNKLVEAGITREVYYHDWLSNPVMVKKHDGSWRMCVDFTDLNKACLQDCYPLPEIDWKMAESKEQKTAFHTSHGVYCYTKMPFSLKNAGATYLVDKAFDNQVGRNIEVYIDDLVIKSHTETKILRDIDETFRTRDKTVPRQNRSCAATLVPTDNQRGDKQVFGQKARDLDVESWKSRKVNTEADYGVTPTHRLCRNTLKAELSQQPDEAPPDTSAIKIPQEPWTLFTDGSSCVDGSGAGLILTSPEGTEFTYALRFQFTASNNKEEYEALIAGLRIAAQMGVRNVHISVDSKLVANQVLGTYVVEEENMVKYLEKAKILISGFANFSISQIPRSKNKKADALIKIASTSFAH